MADFGAIERALGLEGRIRLEAVQSDEGWTTIFKARQLALGRTVAVRLLQRPEPIGPAETERFLKGCELNARVSHPGLAGFHGPAAGPMQLATIHDWVDGTPLSRSEPGSLAPAIAIGHVLQALYAVQALHDSGGWHGDLKPSHLLIGTPGGVMVIGHGFSTLAQSVKDPRTGAPAFCNPAYVSPEQVVGRGAGPASDLYALAVILYELVTGQHPFPAATPAELLEAHVRAPAASASVRNFTLPAAWDRVFIRLLDKAPFRRYGSATEMAAVLRTMLREAEKSSLPPPRGATDSHPILPPPPSAPSQEPPPPSPLGVLLGEKRVLAAAAAACLFMMALVWHTAIREPAHLSTPLPSLEPAASRGSGSPASAEPADREAPGPDLLLEAISRAIASELTISGRVDLYPEPSPLGKANGRSRFLLELLVVDAPSLVTPKLRVSMGGSTAIRYAAAMPGAQPPAVFVEPDLAAPSPRPGNPFPAPTPANVLDRIVWTFEVPAGSLVSGYNRLLLELPSPLLGEKPVVGLELGFGRTAGFPRAALTPRGRVCGRCCQPTPEWRVFYGLFDAGQLQRAGREAMAMEGRWPDCGHPLMAKALALCRLLEERRNAGDYTLTLAANVLGDDPEPDKEPQWELWRRVQRWTNDVIARFPGFPYSWHRLTMWCRLFERQPDSLRAARWSILMDPGNWGHWRELAETEALLAAGQGRKPADAAAVRAGAQALEHIERAMQLLGRRKGTNSGAESLHGRILLLSGRFGEARAAFERALRITPGMLEAKRGLDQAIKGGK